MMSGDPRAPMVFEKDVEDTYAHLCERVRISKAEEEAERTRKAPEEEEAAKKAAETAAAKKRRREEESESEVEEVEPEWVAAR